MDSAIGFLLFYPLDSDLYPMNSAIHRLNNQARINQSQGTLRLNDAIACEQALLFGRVKRVSRERLTERRELARWLTTRQQRQRCLKIEFAFFQSLSRLFLLSYFAKCKRTLFT